MHVTLVGGFNTAHPRAGGTRAYVENLARQLSENGVPHLVLVTGSDSNRGKEWCTIPVRREGSTLHLVASLAANLSELPIPQDSIIHVQRPDYLVPFALNRVGAHWICTIHGNVMQAMSERHNPFVASSNSLVERLILARVRRAVTVDSRTAKAYTARYPWLRTRLTVLPNAVDMRVFKPLGKDESRRQWGLAGANLVYAGRLEPEKRVVDIVRAFRSLQDEDATLVIAGDGREKKAVLEEARGLRVKFLGTVPWESMASLLNAADAVLLYSTREGIPSVALEALACGVPVIATPVGDLPEIIRPGANGFLVETLQELKVAMGHVLERGVASPKAIAQSVEKFSWSIIGPKWLEIYRQIAQMSS